jgi:outer membrane protein, heavy metal efflux system
LRVFLLRGCTLLLLLSGLATAQGSPMTYEQILELAMEKNPIADAQQASLRATQSLVQQAGASPNPIIQLQSQTDGFERSSQLGLSVSQRLELGGKKAARVKAAEAAHVENELRRDQRLTLLRFQIKESFLALLLAQEMEQLAHESLNLTEHHLQIAQARFTAGDISGAEVASLEVERDRKFAQRSLAEGQTARAKSKLSQFLVDSDVVTSGIVGELSWVGPIPELETLLSSSYLPLELAKADVLTKEKLLRLQRTLGVSDITLQAGAFVQRTVFPGSSFTPSGVVAGLDDTGPLFQLQVQIPLPINDNNSGNIAAAAARQEEAVFETQALQRSLIADIEGFYYTLIGQREARSRLEHHALPAAQKALDSVQEAYRLGFRSHLDLLLAKEAYLTTREALLQAAYSESHTVAELERTLGRSLTEKDNES